MRNRLKVIGIVLAIGALLLAPALAQATMLDLTTAGSSGTINGALFQQISQQPTGSGNISSFVRLSTNNTIESGYNTSGRPLTNWPDVNTSPTFTHNLMLSQIPEVTINGVAYRQFLLDINQTNSNPLLSLDSLQIYQGNTGSLTTTTLSDLGTKVYDMGSSNWIKLNYSLNAGSGQGDMYANIPNSVFGTGTYVYLYSSFGANYPNNDGYEEWATVGPSTAPPVPEPSTVLLVGAGLICLAGLRRKIRLG